MSTILYLLRNIFRHLTRYLRPVDSAGVGRDSSQHFLDGKNNRCLSLHPPNQPKVLTDDRGQIDGMRKNRRLRCDRYIIEQKNAWAAKVVIILDKAYAGFAITVGRQVDGVLLPIAGVVLWAQAAFEQLQIIQQYAYRILRTGFLLGDDLEEIGEGEGISRWQFDPLGKLMVVTVLGSKHNGMLSTTGNA